jgi:hypothetical protein
MNPDQRSDGSRIPSPPNELHDQALLGTKILVQLGVRAILRDSKIEPAVAVEVRERSSALIPEHRDPRGTS